MLRKTRIVFNVAMSMALFRSSLGDIQWKVFHWRKIYEY